MISLLVLLGLCNGRDYGLVAINDGRNSRFEVLALLLNLRVIYNRRCVGLIRYDTGQSKVELLVDELVDLFHDLLLTGLHEDGGEAFVVSLERHFDGDPAVSFANGQRSKI